MTHIRNSAKAIITQNGKILLTKNEDEQGSFYLFPGGGQNFGEELSITVIRECLEEIGSEVIVGELIHIREYIGKNHEFAEWDKDIHQIEYYFECSLTETRQSNFSGFNPDHSQVGVEWIEIDVLDQQRFYPKAIGLLLKNSIKRPVYLGDTN